MNFHNLSEKAKLTAAFGSLAVVVMIVSGISLIALNDANERFAGFISGINARAQMAESVRNAVSDRAIAVRNLVLVSSPADIDVEKAAVLDAEKRVESRLDKFNAMVASAKDISENARTLAAEISRIEQLYRPVALEIDRLAASGQRDAAIADIASKCRPLLTALTKAANAYLDATHERAVEMAKESAERLAHERNLLIAFCVAAMALAIGAGIVITRGLMRALGAEPVALAEVTRRVAEGDLRAVPGASNAPAGSVLASMGEMQSSLVRLIGNVRHAADSIATGSSQIASGNVDLSSRTEQQASSLQETASSMEELTTTVKQNAENAQQASTLSANASDVASKGNGVVGEMVGTMGEIIYNSTRIAEITGMIEGIAFQTNILALNAAVEAARCRRTGPRLRRGGKRSAQSCAAFVERGKGDQRSDQHIRAEDPRRFVARGQGRHDDGRSHSGSRSRDRHHGRNRGGLCGTEPRYRTGQSADHADGRGHATERRAGGRSRGCIKVARRSGPAIESVGVVLPSRRRIKAAAELPLRGGDELQWRLYRSR
ncbi:methyl-accepting chemotaxis sensory transducer [Paraburkholderia graminis C4D1M]|uniref:Methyl-accepting chemotaxis sensory transducer n=1 Tax=Paraburkholderia graminis (strain ATCC 700544 / DSM 17151 / LMG 18924 / NCIMB 13744 / C4D1M) TaxID=396598 RepID=B1FU69_PARG4|nr:methyl-accepting chemotaxis sensory transducer [Paraburkholderia graminis C4D1M]